MPPSCSVEYALGPDMGVQRTMDVVLGENPWERGTSHGGEDVGDVAHENGQVGLPICRKDGTFRVLGGSPMIADRLPQVTVHVVGAVTNEEVPTGAWRR